MFPMNDYLCSVSIGVLYMFVVISTGFRFLFSWYQSRDWLGRASPKWPISCQVNQSGAFIIHMCRSVYCVWSCSESDIPKVRLDLLQQKSLMKLAVRLLRNYNLPEGLLFVVVVVVVAAAANYSRIWIKTCHKMHKTGVCIWLQQM